MGRLRIVFLSLLLLASCVSLTESSRLRAQDPSTATIRDLHGKIFRGCLGVGGGSGVAIQSDETGSTILTCAHVVREFDRTLGIEVHLKEVFVSDYEDGMARAEVGKVVAYDDEADLAIVKVRSRHPVFGVMSDADYWGMLVGEEVIGAGHPGEVRPCLISFGFVRSLDREGMLAHSSTAWYGYSGGPVVSRTTGLLVGIESRFDGEILSDRSLAVPAFRIRIFLEKQGIKV